MKITGPLRIDSLQLHPSDAGLPTERARAVLKASFRANDGEPMAQITATLGPDETAELRDESDKPTEHGVLLRCTLDAVQPGESAWHARDVDALERPLVAALLDDMIHFYRAAAADQTASTERAMIAESRFDLLQDLRRMLLGVPLDTHAAIRGEQSPGADGPETGMFRVRLELPDGWHRDAYGMLEAIGAHAGSSGGENMLAAALARLLHHAVLRSYVSAAYDVPEKVLDEIAPMTLADVEKTIERMKSYHGGTEPKPTPSTIREGFAIGYETAQGQDPPEAKSP